MLAAREVVAGDAARRVGIRDPQRSVPVAAADVGHVDSAAQTVDETGHGGEDGVERVVVIAMAQLGSARPAPAPCATRERRRRLGRPEHVVLELGEAGERGRHEGDVVRACAARERERMLRVAATRCPPRGRARRSRQSADLQAIRAHSARSGRHARRSPRSSPARVAEGVIQPRAMAKADPEREHRAVDRPQHAGAELLRTPRVDVDHCNRLLVRWTISVSAPAEERTCVPVPKSRGARTQLSGHPVGERPGGRSHARRTAGHPELAIEILDVALHRAHADDELGRRSLRWSAHVQAGAAPLARARSTANARRSEPALQAGERQARRRR